MRLDPASVAHVYRRVGFGSSPAQRTASANVDDVLQDLFSRRQHEEIFLRGVERILSFEDIERLQAWWMSLILRDGAPLVERVALMWHDHFATSHDKVSDVRLMHAQVVLFRERGLGDFRELLHAIVRDPAMLVWLDGTSNKKGHPNENFARELFELFGLGIGHYTERDIQEAARAFSGHSLEGRRYRYLEHEHDAGSKKVLGREGTWDGDDVVDMVLAHPACPRHIARRLLCEFCIPEPQTAEIEEWAQVLLQEEWHVERTLERLFRSPLFLGPRSRRARIAAPVELLASTAIAAGLAREVAPLDVARAASAMGQALFRPPGVQGWDGGRAWIHAGAWLERHNRLSAWAGRAAPRLARRHPRLDEHLRDWLPDGVPSELRDEALSAGSRLGDPVALERLLGLVWTAPEYHFI